MSEQRISCGEREELVDRLGRSYNGFSDESGIAVIAGGTSTYPDPDTGRRSTVWGYRETGEMVLRDVLWLTADGYRADRSCEHYIPGEPQ